MQHKVPAHCAKSLQMYKKLQGLFFFSSYMEILKRIFASSLTVWMFTQK